MKLNKLKKIINKNFPIIFIIVFLVIVFLINIIFPKKISNIIFIIIFIICILIRIIGEIIYRSKQIRMKIDNKIDTLKKLYKKFNIENETSIVVLITKHEDIIKDLEDKKLPSSITKQKNEYSILIPNIKLKDILSLVKDHNLEKIIIHLATKTKDEKTKNKSASMYIGEKLIIQFNKNTYTKEEIKKIKEELK